MNELKLLNDFFYAIEEDPRISITHIGIYAALLQCLCEQGFINPVHAFSHEIMKMAKLSSAITYHKCVKELSEYGYIRYEPSFNRNKGSRIYFVEKSKDSLNKCF